jgi:hypothetical protein
MGPLWRTSNSPTPYARSLPAGAGAGAGAGVSGSVELLKAIKPLNEIVVRIYVYFIFKCLYGRMRHHLLNDLHDWYCCSLFSTCTSSCSYKLE